MTEEELAPIALQAIKRDFNLTPGMGAGTLAWDPMKGLAAFAQDRADAKRRTQIALHRLGIPETPTVERMNMSPMQAIMHARGR